MFIVPPTRTHFDFVSAWNDLESGIKDIYAKDLSKCRYMSLYHLVYEFCASVGNPASLNLLYEKLSIFFRNYLQGLLKCYEDLIYDDLLLCYSQQWEGYRFSSKVLSDICSYFNKWIRQEIQKGRGDIVEIFHLALVSWRRHILEPMKHRVSASILLLIERERIGEKVNSWVISTTLNSYLESGIRYVGEPELHFYRTVFETDFLADTEVFYNTEISSILRNNSAAEFMKKVETWLKEEKKRARLYLHESTLDSLLNILRDITIKKHINKYISELKVFLLDNKLHDLKRMFRLLSLVPNALDELKMQFEDHVRQECWKAVEEYNEKNYVSAKEYVNSILDIQQRYNSVVKIAFDGEAGFAFALDKACENVVNKNVVTEENGSSNKSAELLAKYCDSLLKKKGSDCEETKIVDNLNQVMVLFKYLEQKDVFQNFYHKLLAKRLVYLSSYDNAESFMVSKLQEECGFQYTSRMQRMLQDVCVSRDLNCAFRKQTDPPPDLDFYVVVVSSSLWPFNQAFYLRRSFNLPQELEQTVQVFQEFYTNYYIGRKLCWLHCVSRTELKSRCFDKPYIFHLSAFEAAILLQFNSGDSFTVSQIQDHTGVKPDILLQVLRGLIKLKLLKLDDQSPLNESSTVSLFLGYRNKRLKVNISIPIKSEIRAEQDSVEKRVGEDRKLLIQATIVRICKGRKNISRHDLLSEVVKHLTPRFMPKIPDIKKCIIVLIEKEYLRRSENDSYSYIS